jgi:hypothetical protein
MEERGERIKKLERKREDTKLIFAVELTDTSARKEEIEGRRKKLEGKREDTKLIL